MRIARLAAATVVAAGTITAAAAIAAAPAMADTTRTASTTHAVAGSYEQEFQRYSTEQACRDMSNTPLLRGRSRCAPVGGAINPWVLFVTYYN
ncbi:hypothetical protein [Allokutzneria oryzae]|uniref:Secreted protein n=1 Tax=Allokutzneria oryzae TaxID=1378989 RepID=A0ABV5ZSM2_9PSEU